MAYLGTPAATAGVIKKHDFRFQKKYGQNFLIDANILQKIVDAAQITKEDYIVEIGPGIGCLTSCLAPGAGKVVCLELDTALQPILARTLEEYGNVEVVYGDALKTDLPSLAAEKFAGLRPVVCANLPYNITSPLITAFLEAGCFETVTVMGAKEVGPRWGPSPGPLPF